MAAQKKIKLYFGQIGLRAFFSSGRYQIYKILNLKLEGTWPIMKWSAN